MNTLIHLRDFSLAGLALTLLLPITANADAEDYRFPREAGITKTGYPLPLTGQPITKTPVIVDAKGVTEKDYPEHYIPGQESLAKNEMRMTFCGSWGPAPLRVGQAASCLLVELGNGENFIFDVGYGSVGNLYALGVHPADLDKLFLTHLHLDHAGGIIPLSDAMGWARNTPLHVWGSSSFTPDMGVSAFVKNIRAASEWHIQSKQALLPVGGMEMVAHEFDYSNFSPENPRQLIYDENGVKVYAFPVLHLLQGAVGFRLEWNGLSVAYVSDAEPSTFEAEQSKGVDVFIHEVFVTAEQFAEKNHMPILHGQNVAHVHASPGAVGRAFAIAKPRLGVGTHFSFDDDLIDSLFERWRETYNGPLLAAQDLTTINITPEQITVRQAKVDLLAWPPVPKAPDEKAEIGSASKAVLPNWLKNTAIDQKPYY